MRYQLHFSSLVVLLFVMLLASSNHARAQSDGRDPASRGWIVDRPEQRQSARPKRRVARPNPKLPVNTPLESAAWPSSKVLDPALGYTLFKVDEAGRASSVTPAMTFAAGDRVRLRLEPSVAGYLYVFDTEDDRNPVMIFPDPRIDDGDNFIDAHAALDLPTSTRTFTITSGASVDRLYVVLASEPLAGVPTDEQLAKYCRDFSCPWRPAQAQWNAVATWAKQPIRISMTKPSSYSGRPPDPAVGGRGLTLSVDDPPPAVIGESENEKAGTVVVIINLRHQ